MATNDTYEYVEGWYRYRKGSNPDQSRKSEGAWRGTTRDHAGHLDGHAEFIPDYEFDGDFDDAYEYVKGEYRFQRGSRPDQSRETAGAWRGTTRDGSGNLNGQAEFFPGYEDESDGLVFGDEDDAQLPSTTVPEYVADESAPDISRLVPLAMVAIAGIAVGVAGVKVAQHVKRRRSAARSEQRIPAPASATPAGWYSIASDTTLLRYWDGVSWTNELARRQVTQPAIAPDWYPDPSNASQVRYWDGSAWTHHVAPKHGAARALPDWYPDPSSPSRWRFWDGNAWTQHVAPGHGTPTPQPPAVASPAQEWQAEYGGDHSPVPAVVEPRVSMSSAEWQAHVRAWMRAGAVQQELWRRLSNAEICDADDATLDAQRKMEQLTPEQGSQRIRLMLDANPSLRDPAALLDFLQILGSGRGVPVNVELVEGGPSRQARH